jgi:hypothetical protein
MSRVQHRGSPRSKRRASRPAGMPTAWAVTVNDEGDLEKLSSLELPRFRIERVSGRGLWKEIRGNDAAEASSRRLPAQKPAVAEDAYRPSARAAAVLEGLRIAQEDLRDAGGAYDLEQIQELLHGVSRQAIDKRVNDGTLLAVPGPSNRRSYPTLQFNEDGSVVQGLKPVREALPTSNPWTVLNFLARPDDRLGGRRPIDVLKAGNIRLVVEAARRVGQQGA